MKVSIFFRSLANIYASLLVRQEILKNVSWRVRVFGNSKIRWHSGTLEDSFSIVTVLIGSVLSVFAHGFTRKSLLEPNNV